MDTIPIYQVPRVVLDTAVKAANLIGKGLYGVDLKMVDDRAYVIEINDNPSIDHGLEDAIIGDEMYYRLLNHSDNKSASVLLPYNICKHRAVHRSIDRHASQTPLK